MPDVKLAIFAYDFPHRRTQDFISKLASTRYRPAVVLAAPRVKLSFPETWLRDKVRHVDLIDTQQLCRELDLPCEVTAHDDVNIAGLLRRHGVTHGLVAGARILRPPTIDAIPGGILNFHPGIIPLNRGLGAVKWAVELDVPQGLTAHQIDRRVDAGLIISRVIAPVYSDDTLAEIDLRLHQTQLALLVTWLDRFVHGDYVTKQPLPRGAAHHPPADSKLDDKVNAAFPAYLHRWAKDLHGWLGLSREAVELDSGANGYRTLGPALEILKAP